MVRAAARISGLSCAVSLSVAVVALVLGLRQGSLALIALGLESVVDAAASGVLVWRFGVEAREPHRAEVLEARASTAIGAVLLMVATYLIVASIRSLAAGPAARGSAGSIAIAAVSLCLLPPIAARKVTLARRIGSRSLRADGALTVAGAVLAAVTLAAVLITRYTGFEAADPIAALVVATALVPEALGAFTAGRT
jgi:divalent metal cation (Fe/Co/Zn/Cd) transporter